MTGRSQRGPRAARGEVRERLLAAARRHFSQDSYERVTLRAIADDAGVDPGLVSYYFGGKTGLFRESMSLPRDPGAEIMTALGEDLDGAAERVLTSLFLEWRKGSASEAASSLLLKSLIDSPDTLDTFRRWLDEEIITPLARKLTGPKRKERAAAATGIIFQMLAIRYLAKIEPIASLPEREVIALYGPLIQRLLTPGRA